MPSSPGCPQITLVTPSFNQGEFIEATLDSVLSQNYPDLQYIVIDGGSTDGTVEILRRYERHLSLLLIEPDQGSADAINKGLRLATGEWFNWLNSDDVLMPGALNQLACHAQRHPDRQWISGCKVNLDAAGSYVSSQAPWRENLAFWLFEAALFPQDATFLRTGFLRAKGIELDVALCNVYDTVLYLQLLAHAEPLLVSSVFSGMRWHPDQKTANTTQRALESEAIRAASRRLPHHHRITWTQRLCASRLAWLARPLLISLANLNLWPSRLNWTVEQYNAWTRSFQLCRIRDCIHQ
ncbi:glycosyltransferase [Synechococcus sp. CS-1324]|uniref:glycosyltransferase family 2 protein n=1 Tax=Synechococcus sp. CS-1324 TaxID=2847980 RepID=UPI000DB5EB0C|nr:glycosyltransferase family 2 protein [Synechococcus sp. CS-1324]MCT0229481.1 glycosyltransferase [Synechococcus sp. CS-1324]PZV04865.1 MAG: glycosyltransferase [Cyanobium sp.]